MIATRRAVLAAGCAALAGSAALVVFDGRNLFYDALTEDFSGTRLTASEAWAMADAGEIVLVDIRRPDEWSETGSAGGSLRLDLRRDDFTKALAAAADGNRDAPIALICARGVRSARLGNRLQEAGFGHIIDIPEGMLGSGAGPGWITRGLPLDRHS